MRKLVSIGFILSLLFLLTNCGKEDKYYQPRITPVEKIFYKHRQSFYVTFPNFVDEELRPNKTYAINYQIPNADKLGDIDVSVQSFDGYKAVVEKTDNSKGVIRITTSDSLDISEVYFLAQRKNETPVLYSINMRDRITVSIPSTIFAAHKGESYPVDLPLDMNDYIVSIPLKDKHWIASEKGDSIIDETDRERRKTVEGRNQQFFERFRDMVVDAAEAFSEAVSVDQDQELTEKDFPKYENLLPFKIETLNKHAEQDSVARYSIIRLLNEQGKFLKTIFITQTNISKITINVDKPGTLVNNVYFGDYESITKMAITGNADSSDLACVRHFNRLTSLDLSKLNATKLTCKISNPMLSKVILPESLVEIGEKVFEECKSLREVDLANVAIIGNYAFKDCVSLSKVNFPENTTSIGAFSFSGCKSLESVILPPKVDTLGCSAFSYCHNLKNVKLNDGENGLTSIGHYAFAHCNELTSITIPSTVVYVGERVFYDCEKLTRFYGKVATPDGRAIVVNNEMRAFLPVGLTRYVIPSNVTNIGEFVFFLCDKMTEIVIPTSVKAIKNSAFFGCRGLEAINIPNSVEIIKTTAFAYCSNLKKIKLPESVTIVEDWAFDGCTNLKEVELSSATTEIEAYAFSGCEALDSFSIPVKTNIIGDYAFSGCTNIKEVSIPESVKSLGVAPFQSCFNLGEIRCGATTPPTLGISLGESLLKLNSVFVPQPSVNNYKSAEVWSQFANKMKGEQKSE